MNKYSLVKNILALSASAISFIISLVLFIKSYSYYADEYGTDISFNNNYVIALVVSLILVCYLSYNLYLLIKTNETSKTPFIGLACTGLVGCYSLGVFFKALFKAMSKNKPFDYTGNQNYLYIGIVFVIIAAIYTLSAIEKKSSN